MKDLSEYIRTLIGEVNLPLEIRLREDGVYRVDVNVDLRGSWVLYKINHDRDNKDVRNIRVQLKKYLPQLNFVVKVNYINYPKEYSIPLLHEYIIKPRVWQT
jgi:hypothetical protein